MEQLKHTLHSVITRPVVDKILLFLRSSKRSTLLFFGLFGVGSLVIIFRYTKIYFFRRFYNYPPGLFGVPIFGAFLIQQSAGAKYLNQIVPSYGPITHAPSGAYTDIVYLNDPLLVRKVMDLAIDRPKSLSTLIHANADVVLINEDENWSLRRKSLMNGITTITNKKMIADKMYQILKTITFDKLNQNIQDGEKRNNSNSNSNENGFVWYPREDISNAIFNIIYFASFGEFLQSNDEKYQAYSDSIKTYNRLLLDGIGASFFPKVFGIMIGLGNAKAKVNDEYLKLQAVTCKDYLKGKKKYLSKIEQNGGDQNVPIETLLEQAYYDRIIDRNIKPGTKEYDTTESRLISDLFICLDAGIDSTS